MLSLLIKLFIKDSENVKNVKVREKYGVVCGGYGIFLNCLLFAGKFIAGVISSSIAMTADAFNNLSDAGSSLVSMIGFKMSGQKPDTKHPFGHGRIEYLAGLIVSGLIIVMGYELVKDSFAKILHPEETVFSILAIIILGASIFVKFYMSFYSKRIGKKIDSQAILAVSTDSLSDTISTFVVLACSLISHFFNISLDGWCGLLVGIIIVFAGVKAAKETIDPLLGMPPTEEFVKAVSEIVESHVEIVGMHDLIVHDYGPGRVMLSLHAEVPSIGDINVLHDVIDNTEKELATKLNCHAVIHMDPVEVGNDWVDSLKDMVKEIVFSIDESMSIHDFRVVSGPTHTNLIFDVVAPYKLKLSDAELVDSIQKKVWEKDTSYFCVIDVDREYTGK